MEKIGGVEKVTNADVIQIGWVTINNALDYRANGLLLDLTMRLTDYWPIGLSG